MAEESIILISKDYADSNLIERGEYTELENKVDGNTTGITNLGNTVNTVKGDVDDLKPKVATLEQSVESNSQAITTLEQDVAKKQDDVGLYIDNDGNVTTGTGIKQYGLPYSNYFEGFTQFDSGIEIGGQYPVLDVTSSDGSVTITRSGDGYGVDLKANGGGGEVKSDTWYCKGLTLDMGGVGFKEGNIDSIPGVIQAWSWGRGPNDDPLSAKIVFDKQLSITEVNKALCSFRLFYDPIFIESSYYAFAMCPMDDELEAMIPSYAEKIK